jgi:hypothetical protein
LNIGIPSQYLKATENWLLSKYLKFLKFGAADSQRAAPTAETALKRAFYLVVSAGLLSREFKV